MKIDPVYRAYGHELQKSSGIKPADKSDKTAKSDSVSLSKKAKDLASSGAPESVTHRVQSLPDVRPDKVQDAKEKIASGYFNSPDFEDKLADRLMKEFGF
jgi:flagellar biosynthesis anti-sigma factor FlgM